MATKGEEIESRERWEKAEKKRESPSNPPNRSFCAKRAPVDKDQEREKERERVIFYASRARVWAYGGRF